MFVLTESQLLADLNQAFRDAIIGKSSKPYVLRFASHLEENLEELCEELWTRTYKPRPSSCFIITYPKQREVFAAEFRDRVVHHLYYNYTYELFSRTFIQDTYSCLPERGTHYGIDRLEMHIRQESLNWTMPCYVLKMDISGYFMHINRNALLSLCLETFRKMSPRRILKRVPVRWCDRIDFDFIEYLTREIVLLDPAVNCRIVGSLSDWDGLPDSKSIFHTPDGCGLPIGNLTSQLFSNVYLNVLDQWMKRDLGCRHYGRYVDDFYVVSCDRRWLESIEPKVDSFLRDNLGLALKRSKTELRDVRHGVQFLGAFLLPHRRYASKNTVRHIRECVDALDISDSVHCSAVLNSCLGVLSHYRSYNICRSLLS